MQQRNRYRTAVIAIFSAINIPVLNLLNLKPFKHITKDIATLHKFVMFPDLKDSFECTFYPYLNRGATRRTII